jgi:uncharacterized membrane protein
MFYALLKTIHLLSIVVWIGGMFFTVYCLRPAATLLEPPQRVQLMVAALGRFMKVVMVAAGLTLVTGVWMIGRAAKATVQSGGSFNMPLDWYVMVVLGVLMMAVYGHIRWVLFKRLEQAANAQAWPVGAQVLGSIRQWVVANVILGVVIIVATRLGAVS